MEGVLATVLDFGEQLQQLWTFAHGVEQHLDQRLVELRRVGEAEGWWREEYFTEIIGSTFPRFLRYSVILTIYGITEGTLTEICGFVQRRRQIPFAVHETRGSGLRQRVQYLSRCLGEQFTVPDQLHHLAAVRHCIAHVSGDLLNWNQRHNTLRRRRRRSGSASSAAALSCHSRHALRSLRRLLIGSTASSPLSIRSCGRCGDRKSTRLNSSH